MIGILAERKLMLADPEATSSVARISSPTGRLERQVQ